MLFDLSAVAAAVAIVASSLGRLTSRNTSRSVTSLMSSNLMRLPLVMPRANIGNEFELRIYPLGDSITSGIGSSGNNGYRIGLQRNLAGSKLLFVGSKSGGTMSNNWNEGWDGHKILQIAEKAKRSQRSLDPNIILLHAGTNDLNASPPDDPSHAPDRLGSLIDQIVADTPEAVVLVAQIIQAADTATTSRIQAYNNAIPNVVNRRAISGHKVMVLDFRSITVADLKDGLHPNDAGYQKMADIWLKGIQEASNKGWIQAPNSPEPKLGSSASGSNDRYCLQPPFWVEAIKSKPIATGVGHNGDMKFHSNWVKVDSHATGIGKDGNGVVFADLNGDKRADYLYVNETSGSVITYLNIGSGDEMSWAPVNGGKDIASGVAPRELIRFVDIDLDGKDDYVVLGKQTASVTVFLNRGPKQGAPGNWVWDGPHEVAPGAPGAKGADIVFADINNDGRPDYLAVDKTGAVNAFLNIGRSHMISGIHWNGAGQIANGFGSSDIAIKDMTGDGRADYLQWSNTAEVKGYLNYRTENEGQPGWAHTNFFNERSSGKTSSYNRLADFNGDGKVDYAQISDNGAVTLWLNKGQADTSVTGDGVHLADLNGDGLDDYVWLAANAAPTLYLNGGRAQDGQAWSWYPANGGKEVATGAGARRGQIIFADMDGDGKDDFCIVDPKSGAIILYKNGGPQAKGDWLWTPANNGKPIATGLGPGKNVRLADMDGDGKADYLILGPRGEASLYLNKGEKTRGWNWVAYNDGNPIATGIGFDPDHVQFKDINGDKKADYIGVGLIDGSAVVYANHGPQPGGKWLWIPMNNAKPIATGVGVVGADVRWGRMEKNHRYSYLAVSPNTGALRAWLNGCNELSPQTGGSGSGSGSSGGTGTGNPQHTGSTNPSNPSATSGDSGSSPGDADNPGGSGNGGSGGNEGNGSGGGPGNSGSESTSPSNESPPNGESLTGEYLGGGQEIPAAGLSALGLATVGVPAIVSLTPFAITAQNDLTTANEALKALTEGAATAGGVLAAASAVEIAAKDFGSLSKQAKLWDLNFLSDGLKGEAQQQQEALQDAAKSLSDLVPRLRGCGATVKRSDSCPTVFKSAAETVGGNSAVTPLTWFTQGNVSELPPFLAPTSGSGSGSASGISSSGSGGSSGSTLPGGLPFPIGGLRSLGLPNKGAAAINGLKPYAISAQNAVSKALGLLNGLSGGASTSGAEAAAAVDSLATAASELSTALGDIELSAVPGAQVFEAQQTPSALQALANQLRNALPPLRKCISNPGACRNVYRGTTGIIGGASIGVPLAAIINYDSTGKVRPIPVVPPNSTTTATSLPTEWILNTIPGTSVKDFRAFIQTLPDRGSGKQMIFDGSDYQNYVTKMTRAEALLVNKAAIVDMMTSNAPVKLRRQNLRRHSLHNRTTGLQSHLLESRTTNPEIVRTEQRQRYQQMISTPKTQSIAAMHSDVRYGYLYHYERSSGLGSHIYVFDDAFEFQHREFAGRTVESYVVPGLTDDTGAPATDIGDDHTGHGTRCAALAGGNALGIAKNVRIKGIKFASGNSERAKPEDLIHAWRWAIRDARMKNRLGKTVFSMSWCFATPESDLPNQQHVPAYYRAPFNIPPPWFADWWPPLLAEAWREDIVTVFPIGNLEDADEENLNPVTSQGSEGPMRFCKPNNPCIGVGSVEADGRPSQFNLPIGPDPAYTYDRDLGGEETIFAHGSEILVADVQQSNNPAMYTVDSGTSYASPQIAGLAAYFLSLPNSVQPPPGEVAMAVKRQLVGLARDSTVDAPKLAYNGVWDTPCGALTKREKEELQSLEAASVLEKLKGLYLAHSLAT